VDPGGEPVVVMGGGAMTPSEAAKRHKRSSDRLFKWTAALAAACLIGFVVFVVVRGPAHPATVGSSALEAPPPPVLKPGTLAPPFSLPQLQGGQPVSLSAFRGRPVIVNFFASWCRDCRAELGAMARVARATSGRVAVIGIDTNETSDAAATRLLAGAHANYPVVVDPQAKVAAHYLVQALPVSYFLTASGRVVGAALGPQTVSSLDRWVTRLGAKQ
jgi:cytochrome c biogenesis protein CcmG, thiol:disulfide interchange protein DsbE